jgi:predicted RNA methylase
MKFLMFGGLMENYQDKLTQITEILLKSEDDYGEIKKATDDLYNLFLSVSGLKEEDESCRKDYYLPKGKAIGTVWAAMCIKELLRTKRFIRGVFLGIKRCQEKFSHKPIHILYAGTGPFATLLMPLTTVFTSKEVKFTLLEINPDSIEILRKVIKNFEVEDYIYNIVQCDATEYKTEKDKPIHMVVTETMQNALKNEPQVAITLNLVSQMEEGGILIPQNITVEVALLDLKRDMERMMGVEGAEEDHCYHLNKIFELNKNSVAIKKKEEYFFPEVEVEFPKDVEERYKRLSLLTDIQVFEDEKLTYKQCSLNLPHKVMDIDWGNNNIKKVGFQYVINENPGFAYIEINNA